MFSSGLQWYERSEIIVAFPLGSGQAVRLLTLDQVIGGSNPPSPASSGADHASGLRSPDLDLGQRSDGRIGVVKIPRIEWIRWGSFSAPRLKTTVYPRAERSAANA